MVFATHAVVLNLKHEFHIMGGQVFMFAAGHGHDSYAVLFVDVELLPVTDFVMRIRSKVMLKTKPNFHPMLRLLKHTLF